jgi:hypothetical protein
MTKYKLLLIIALLHGFISAQSSPGPGYLSQLTFPMVEVPIEGNPYYDEAYRLGEVFFEGEKYRFFFRYNALRDRIELKDASKRLFHLQKNEIIEPKFGGKIYQLKSYYSEDTLRKGYFVPLNKGNTVLYFKPKKVFIQAKKPDNGYETYMPPYYRDISTYYVQFNNYLLRPIELTRRSFLNMFHSRRPEIEEYARRNELDYRDKRDAVILVNYYNRITSTESSK